IAVADVLDHVFDDRGSQGAALHQGRLAIEQRAKFLLEWLQMLFRDFGASLPRQGHRQPSLSQPRIYETEIDCLIVGEVSVDKRKATHKGERHGVERRFVVDIHGADDAPAWMNDVVVATQTGVVNAPLLCWQYAYYLIANHIG